MSSSITLRKKELASIQLLGLLHTGIFLHVWCLHYCSVTGSIQAMQISIMVTTELVVSLLSSVIMADFLLPSDQVTGVLHSINAI